VRVARSIEARARPLLVLAIAVILTLTSPIWIDGPLPATLADALPGGPFSGAALADGDKSSAGNERPLPVARVGFGARVDAQ